MRRTAPRIFRIRLFLLISALLLGKSKLCRDMQNTVVLPNRKNSDNRCDAEQNGALAVIPFDKLVGAKRANEHARDAADIRERTP